MRRTLEMRTLIACDAVSLGGYCAGPSDDVMVLKMDPAFIVVPVIVTPMS